MKYNKLVRDNVAGLLKSKGYLIHGKKLKGEKYKTQLYCLFWQEFKAVMDCNSSQILIHYAEMLEIIRTLMVVNKVNIKQVKLSNNQPIMWYQNFASPEQKLASARTDLLQKFEELLTMKTEAVKDQLGDILNSFNNLLNVNNLNFSLIEKLRRLQSEKFGGFSQGVYLKEVLKIKTVESNKSV